MTEGLVYEAAYGKVGVKVYRAYARPLGGITPIPESAFSGRENALFAFEVDVEVIGNNFLPAYTLGDNSNVVATDSMKNFVLRHAIAYDGATLEGFLDSLGRALLSSYAQMPQIRVTGREMPFVPARVPLADGTFGDSSLVYSRTGGDYSWAMLDFTRDSEQVVLFDHRCGRAGMALLKVTGSSFTRFVRDAHTTLPERSDRPLFIPLDIAWTYSDPAVLMADEHSRYVPGEQVRDIACAVFDSFVSESIQHLVHEMGLRMLERFPQLSSVSFTGQNHTPDPVGTSETNPKARVYTAPFQAYGQISLTMRRGE